MIDRQIFNMTLPLTDIDVRQQDDGPLIEFATFCEGEYVESVCITRERAAEIHAALGLLLADNEGISRLVGELFGADKGPLA